MTVVKEEYAGPRRTRYSGRSAQTRSNQTTRANISTISGTLAEGESEEQVPAKRGGKRKADAFRERSDRKRKDDFAEIMNFIGALASTARP
jgi:hypothetical protein